MATARYAIAAKVILLSRDRSGESQKTSLQAHLAEGDGGPNSFLLAFLQIAAGNSSGGAVIDVAVMAQKKTLHFGGTYAVAAHNALRPVPMEVRRRTAHKAKTENG